MNIYLSETQKDYKTQTHNFMKFENLQKKNAGESSQRTLPQNEQNTHNF